jgi:hypothetical protein
VSDPRPAVTHEGARRWATHWCQRWFLDREGRDRIRLDGGIDAGWATHVEAFLILERLALEARGEAQPPDRSVASRVKAAGFDRWARAALLRLAGRGPRERGEMVGGAALIVEIPTPSMLDPAAIVARELPVGRRHVAAADPRALRRLRATGLEAVALLLPWREERRALAAARPLTAAALESIAADPPVMELDGRDLAAHAVAALRRSLGRSIPWLAPESRALARFLERVRPTAVAIASDQHRIGRLTVMHGRRLGLQVVVLQHGLPQSEIGYLPVVADRVAAWSPESAAWFADRGTDPARLVVTGNPRLDAVGPGRAAETPASSDRRVLLALSPASVQLNAAIAELALDLAAGGRTSLKIKLHPGHRDWGFVTEAVRARGLADRVLIVHHDPLPPLLEWADLMLVHRSTVAVEALAAGVPVIAVEADPGQPSMARLELEPLRLPTAVSRSSLADLVEQLAQPAARRAYLDERSEQIERFVGPHDGRSAARIADLLLGG